MDFSNGKRVFNMEMDSRDLEYESEYTQEEYVEKGSSENLHFDEVIEQHFRSTSTEDTNP